MTSIKMSEAGIIPEDWSVIQVRDIGKIKNGINKPKEAFGSGTPFVNLMDVFGKSTIGTATPLELLETTKTERNTYDLKAGDVLFIRSSVKPSGVGLTTLVKQDLPDTVFSGFLLRFRDSGNLDVSFKEHCFHAGYFRNSLIVNSTVSANTNINQSALGRLWLIVPPLPEQQAIAAALSDADGVVAGLERVIAKKRLIKQGAMQDLLTARRRLPGFSGEWEVKRLGDLMSMKSGDAITSAFIHEEGDYPVFGGNGLRGFTNSFNRDGECTLVGRQGALCGVVTHTVGKIFASEHAIVCKATAPNCQQFISHRLEYADLNKVSESSAQPGLSVEKIKKIEIDVPLDGLEQKAIAAVLSDIDAEIQTLESRLGKARAVKEGMMQNLLTGRVRLV